MLSFLIAVIKDFAEQISDKYKGLMMKLCLQITGNREDAEESYNDALMALHLHQNKISDINSKEARNYIYTVTRNAALKKKYSQSKYNCNVTFSDVEGLLSVEGEPDINVFRDEYGFSQEVADALKSLSIEDHDLVCYYYGAGYSYKEISEIMGVSAVTLRKRMERCRAKLAEIIDRENI